MSPTPHDGRGAEAAASESRSEIGGRRRLNILFPGRECSPGRRLRPRSASVPALGAQGLRRREKSPPSTPLFVIHKWTRVTRGVSWAEMPGLRPLSWAEGTNPKPKFIANPL